MKSPMACVRRPRSSLPPSELHRPASPARTMAHAGTYPMYACDVPGVNLPSPTRAAWAYDTRGAGLAHYTCVTQHSRGGCLLVPDQLPDGVLGQTPASVLELADPRDGPQSAISIERVVDWTETQLTARAAGQAPA